MFKDKQQNRLAQFLGDRQWFKSISARLGWKPQPDKWIFIVGCYNSGTTLLQKMLASHPTVGTLPREGVFLTDALPYPEQYGWTRMWHKCLAKMNRDLNKNPQARANRAKKQWSVWFPEGASCLLEKSIANTTRMLFLQRYFQPAYFIHIVRNGYAVAEGIRRKANLEKWPNPEYNGSYPIELCARQWRRNLEIVGDVKPDLNNYYELSYENLTAQPHEELQKIYQFLELKPPGEKKVDKKWEIHEKKETIKNMNSRSFNRLSAKDKRQIDNEAGDLLKEKDYYRD
jgi:hypothetical protein